MRNLVGKVAFVTGGASGLGFALARTFGREGVRVAIADVQPDRLEAAAEQLRSEGIAVYAARLDVADRDSFRAVADEVEGCLGPVDLLFNNAGVGISGQLADSTFSDWDWILGVNLGGVVNGLCTFLPRIRARGRGGHVISTASAAGLFASENLGVYVASKMAVVGAMEVLRAELASEGIGVSVLCPHLMRSRIHEHESLRPVSFKDSGYASTPPELADKVLAGMDPMDVAQHALQAVRDNRLYVIPYPELGEIIRARADALLASLPTTEPDPARVAAERDTLTFGPYAEALLQAQQRHRQSTAPA